MNCCEFGYKYNGKEHVGILATIDEKFTFGMIFDFTNVNNELFENFNKGLDSENEIILYIDDVSFISKKNDIVKLKNKSSAIIINISKNPDFFKEVMYDILLEINNF